MTTTSGPRPTPLSRRAVLRGVGCAVALPWLEAMAPARARRARDQEPAPPLRLAVLSVPNGVIARGWMPAAEGAGFELPPTLAPLAPFRDDLLVLSGLALDAGRAHGDGPGDHARACASFLTGAHPRKTAGKDLFAGASLDQVAAAALGAHTRLPSLELSCEPARLAGSCDSGYACAYSTTVSWSTPATPLPRESDPRRVFDRLFLQRRPGESAPAWEERMAQRKSVLDWVRADAASLAGRLGAADRAKLAEYQDAVREVERRIERLTADGGLGAGSGAGGGAAGAGARESADAGRFEHVEHGLRARTEALLDLTALAFRADLTRIATVMLANEGSNRSFPELGAPEGHHTLSHHGGDEEKIGKLLAIDRDYVAQLARFLGRLAETQEGGARLLDRALVLYGGGLGDGNAHTHADLPLLLAGRAAGQLAPGRHLRFPRETPACALHLALLARLGVELPSFGDASEPLAGLG